VVIHDCNPSKWEIGQENLEFEASLDYTARACLKNQNKKHRFIAVMNTLKFLNFATQLINEYQYTMSHFIPPPSSIQVILF
jgi:hypothetical protein